MNLGQSVRNDTIGARAVTARIFAAERIGDDKSGVCFQPCVADCWFACGGAHFSRRGVSKVVVQADKKRKRKLTRDRLSLGKIGSRMRDSVNGAHIHPTRKAFQATPEPR